MTQYKKTTVLVIFIAFISVWEILCRSIIPAYVVASPIQILKELISNFNYFFINIKWTCLAAVLGLFTGLFFALLLSICADAWRASHSIILTIALAAQSTPIIIFYPILYLVAGSFFSRVIISALLVFVPALIFILQAFREKHDKFEKSFSLLNLSYYEKLRWYKIPNALPSIFASAKLGAANAVIGTVVAEWLSGEKGLGYIATISLYEFNTPRLYTTVFCSLVLSLSFYFIVRIVELNYLSISKIIALKRLKKIEENDSPIVGSNKRLSPELDINFQEDGDWTTEKEILAAMGSDNLETIKKALPIALWIQTPEIIRAAQNIWNTKKHLFNKDYQSILAKLSAESSKIRL